MGWIIIATWKFAYDGINAASTNLKNGGSALDAVEVVARMAEDNTDVHSVGTGGFPNNMGEVELDAAFMDGRDLSIGAVAAVKGFKNPVSIARDVMMNSPHTFLVGQGAEDFAIHKGYDRAVLVTDEMRKAWEERKADSLKNKVNAFSRDTVFGHDTIGIASMDTSNNIACCTSTSGAGMKYRGRVGDSPLVGAGFYADNEMGAVTATGLGEDIMKGCTCYYIAELMSRGVCANEAAKQGVLRTHNRLAKSNEKVGDIAVVCIDKNGNFGAAANHSGFEYVVASDRMSPTVFKAKSCI